MVGQSLGWPFPSVSAQHFVSIFDPVCILLLLLKERRIHTLVFLLELHVVCELYLRYSEHKNEGMVQHTEIH